MTEYKISNAKTHKEKDTHEILIMCALPGIVIGGMSGYFMLGVVGAVGGVIVGGAIASGIAYWVLNNSGAVAKEMDTKKTKE